MTDTQTIIQLTAKNFDEWLKISTVEYVKENTFLVLTDYENAIEVDTAFEEKGISFWKVTNTPFPLTAHQLEKMFEVIDDFLRPCDEGEPSIEKNGIYSPIY